MKSQIKLIVPPKRNEKLLTERLPRRIVKFLPVTVYSPKIAAELIARRGPTKLLALNPPVTKMDPSTPNEIPIIWFLVGFSLSKKDENNATKIGFVLNRIADVDAEEYFKLNCKRFIETTAFNKPSTNRFNRSREVNLTFLFFILIIAKGNKTKPPTKNLNAVTKTVVVEELLRVCPTISKVLNRKIVRNR